LQHNPPLQADMPEVTSRCPLSADFVAEVAEERGKLGLGAEMEP